MNHIDWKNVDNLIEMALEEDVGSGDVTTGSIIPKGQMGRAQITAKKPTVVAGLFLVERILHRLDPAITVSCNVSDGKKVNTGSVLCRMEGPYDVLLTGERTVLNFLQRLCGVATLSHRFARAVRHTQCKVLDTRKTTPGFRSLEKYAVRCAGAHNHRIGLYDAILIKENHIAAAGSIPKAIKKSRKAHPDLPVEVEVSNIEEMVLAVEYGADIVLLDNMNLGQISKGVQLVGDRVILEVSGGVTLSRVKQIAETGVHRVSVGALTHSAPSADLSMLILPTNS